MSAWLNDYVQQQRALRAFGVLGLLVGLILLATPVGRNVTGVGGVEYGWDCGSVLSPETSGGGQWEKKLCPDEISSRLLWGLIVAGVGVVALVAAVKTKDEESDPEDRAGAVRPSSSTTPSRSRRPAAGESKPPVKADESSPSRSRRTVAGESKPPVKADESSDSLVAELERLKRLADDGFLTEEEVEQAKRRLLDG